MSLKLENGMRIPQRILVTGGAGFIGHHLVKALVASGATITVLDDLSTGDAKRLPPDTKLIVGDVTDSAIVKKVSANQDMVIHLASVVGMRLADVEVERAFNISVEGTKTVLASSDCPVVLFSSSSVYGLDSGAYAVNEQNTADYADLAICDGGRRGYASGKWQVEQLGLAASEKGRDILILRPFNVVGPGQTGQYGMVVPTFTRAALMGDPLTIYDDGLQTRAFGDVTTFVSVLSQLFLTKAAWTHGTNIINVGNPQKTSILELANMIIYRTQSTGDLKFIPYESIFVGRRDTRERMPDCSLLDSLIGQTHWPELSSIIDRIIADITAQSKKYVIQPRVMPETLIT